MFTVESMKDLVSSRVLEMELRPGGKTRVVEKTQLFMKVEVGNEGIWERTLESPSMKGWSP